MTDGPDDRQTDVEIEEDADWAWAREWVRQWPTWSDEQWQRISSGLGYGPRQRAVSDDPLAEVPES